MAGTFKYTYTPLGQYQSVTFPNGQTRGYTYDDQGRLLQLANALGATNLATYAYGYDRNQATGQNTMLGQRSSMTATVPAQGLSTAQSKYYYDPLYQLTRVDYPSGAPFDGEVHQWTYDAIGNRLTNTVNAATQTYTYLKNGANPLNGQRLSNDGVNAYTWDNNGSNLTRNGVPGNFTFGYDVDNRLSSITGAATASYTYDYQGRRTSKTVGGVTTTYLYDGLNLVAGNDGRHPGGLRLRPGHRRAAGAVPLGCAQLLRRRRARDGRCHERLSRNRHPLDELRRLGRDEGRDRHPRTPLHLHRTRGGGGRAALLQGEIPADGGGEIHSGRSAGDRRSSRAAYSCSRDFRPACSSADSNRLRSRSAHSGQSDPGCQPGGPQALRGQRTSRFGLHRPCLHGGARPCYVAASASAACAMVARPLERRGQRSSYADRRKSLAGRGALMAHGLAREDDRDGTARRHGQDAEALEAAIASGPRTAPWQLLCTQFRQNYFAMMAAAVRQSDHASFP